MATATKLWQTSTDLTSWTATVGASTTSSKPTTNGQGGSTDAFLQLSITGRSKSASSFWQISDTWVNLFGIPSNGVVTNILASGDGYFGKCVTFTTGAASTDGPLELRDSAGTTLLLTLVSGRAYSATDASWVARNPGSLNQAVPSAQQAASTTVTIRVNCTLATGNSTSAVNTLGQDAIKLTITYQLAISQTEIGIYEARTQITPTGQISYESRQQIAQLNIADYEARKGLVLSKTTNYESLQNTPVSHTAITPYEAKQALLLTKSSAYETKQPLLLTKSSAYESLQALLQNKIVVYEAIKGLHNLGLAADNFDRPDGGLGTNWSASSMTIASGAVVGHTGNWDISAWLTTAFGLDQYSQITVGSMDNVGGIGPVLRYTSASYYFAFYFQGFAYLYVWVGAWTQLASIAQAAHPGDVLELRATGVSPVTLKVFHNGSQIISYTDSTYNITNPYVGIAIYSASPTATIASWSAGDIGGTGLSNYETLRQLTQSVVEPYEFLEALAKSAAQPYESLAASGNSVSHSAVIVYEALQQLATSKPLFYEALKSLAVVEASNYEVLTRLLALATPRYESLQALISAGGTPPYEARGGLTQSKGVNYESLKALAASTTDVYEALERLAKNSVAPYETQQQGLIVHSLSIPYESYQKLVNPLIQVYEAQQSVRASETTSYEGWLGVVNALAQWYETQNRVSKPGTAAYEAYAAVSKSLSGFYETLIRVVAQYDIPYSSLEAAIQVVVIGAINMYAKVIFSGAQVQNQFALTDTKAYPTVNESGISVENTTDITTTQVENKVAFTDTKAYPTVDENEINVESSADISSTEGID